MSLTTEYNTYSPKTSTTVSASSNRVSSNNDNFHRTKLEGVLDGYNNLYGDSVTILSSNEDCSEVILTKPKDQFKLITKIEARMSGKKKFTETDDSLVMTRTWN